MSSRLFNLNSYNALCRCAAVIGLFVLTSANATNGTSPFGYGAASQGMGGVGIALPTDAVAAANNPAGMGLIGQRWDADLGLLMLDRGVRINGTEINANRRKLFPIPEAGLTRKIDNDLTIGISLFNNGVNTSYGQPIGPPTNSNAGASLMEIIVAPTVSYQASRGNWFGASIDLAYQRLKLEGLENVGLEDQGTGTAHGAAVSVGWLGQLNSQISLGASFRTKTDMTRQDKYKTLLANQGKLDIPGNAGVGVAVRPTNQWTLSADILKTFYSKVHAYGNTFFTTAPLGATDGPGFGWRDQTVFKIGGEYKISGTQAVRAGYSHGTRVVPSSETFLNYLSPAVAREHYTIGYSFGDATSKLGLFTFAYAYQPKVTQSGSGGSAGIDPYLGSQWLSVGYGASF